ncbi:hypothetical protein O1Q98_11910 [Dickeya lacustris]|uniref:Uncharacterized protein n=1 Tax=Dickeya lacustris TaxID=2259638 RepID=A0ABY8G374_9GAMM|nr:hypothetical protein [Dickeya lacustris]WFN54391.1 hypothetical protein O1Q98_11910 [Dickeya lacustris]
MRKAKSAIKVNISPQRLAVYLYTGNMAEGDGADEGKKPAESQQKIADCFCSHPQSVGKITG